MSSAGLLPDRPLTDYPQCAWGLSLFLSLADPRKCPAFPASSRRPNLATPYRWKRSLVRHGLTRRAPFTGTPKGRSFQKLQRFFRELKRRNVYKVAGTCAIVAFVVRQAASPLLPALRFPAWTIDGVIVLPLLGFPLAVVLPWAFEMTPQGVRRTRPTAGTSQKGEQLPKLSPAAQAAIGIAAMVLVGALGWRTWEVLLDADAGEPAVQATSERESDDPARIAVLYLDYYSEREEASHVAHGRTEALIHRLLSQVEALDVVSRNGVRPFRSGEVGTDE